MQFPAGRMYLYLTQIGEPRDNELRVVVVEANPGPPEQTELGEARPIQPNSSSRVFELRWETYIAYAVRNESFATAEPGEVRSADSFYTRDSSAFLDYVRASTFATEDYPGPFRHWALDALNHCLDVVSVEDPRVQLLEPSDEERDRLGWPA